MNSTTHRGTMCGAYSRGCAILLGWFHTTSRVKTTSCHQPASERSACMGLAGTI